MSHDNIKPGYIIRGELINIANNGIDLYNYESTNYNTYSADVLEDIKNMLIQTYEEYIIDQIISIDDIDKCVNNNSSNYIKDAYNKIVSREEAINVIIKKVEPYLNMKIEKYNNGK